MAASIGKRRATLLWIGQINWGTDRRRRNYILLHDIRPYIVKGGNLAPSLHTACIVNEVKAFLQLFFFFFLLKKAFQISTEPWFFFIRHISLSSLLFLKWFPLENFYCTLPAIVQVCSGSTLCSWVLVNFCFFCVLAVSNFYRSTISW